MLIPLAVFIVDDDKDDTDMFCEVISEINNSVKCTAASNGKEALQLLENERVLPDFLFLDLNMPGMNGKQLLKQLKQNQKLTSIPVIIYSTSNLEADKEITRQLGASYFLTKPDSMKQLKKDLEFVFDKKYEHNQVVTT
ncbi:response regulator [Segetibacter koreensis]|uniref:response regulator n=1 Tax=Segetibacter koreensis TaxID=398037 RepID=UPI0003A7D382|nr:response regulator [Segetibacter koreensis]